MVCRLIRLLICVMLLSGCAGSFSKMSKTDYEYQAVATIETVIDLKQTRRFEREGRNEQSTLLGDHPSDSKINTLGALAIAGQWLGAWALPVEASIFGIEFNPRRVFQVGVIVGEGWAVHHNYSIGVRIDL